MNSWLYDIVYTRTAPTQIHIIIQCSVVEMSMVDDSISCLVVKCVKSMVFDVNSLAII